MNHHILAGLLTCLVVAVLVLAGIFIPYLLWEHDRIRKSLRYHWRDRRRRRARLRDIFGGSDESDLTYPRLDDPQLDLRGRKPGGRWPR